MSRLKRACRLSVVLSSLLGWAGCAPIEPPDTDGRSQGSTDYAATETISNPPSPRRGGLDQRIETALDQVRHRELLTTNSFWTVFHGILGLGPAATLRNPETGIKVNALDYVCQGGELRGLEFIPTPYGLDVRTGPQFVGQGHQDQFIAEMTQWGLSGNHKFIVQGKEYCFQDFIRHAQARVRVTGDQELSWALLALGQNLGLEAKWTNASGEPLCIDDIVRYEAAAPVEQAPCGGTHRLFALTWVYYLRLGAGGRDSGIWGQVVDKLLTYQGLARKYQNADGLLSTNFFSGPGEAADVQLRINTTGHTLEWLALSLSDAELESPWVQNAASALALLLIDSQAIPMESGSLYHAAHGLRIYQARAYGRNCSEVFPFGSACGGGIRRFPSGG